MKSCALRKAVSIACVLALLLSVCVVSFAGAAGAVVGVKLNNCGTVTNENLSVGDAIPDPTSPISGAEFLGWYNKALTTRYTNVTTGVTEYFAKYASTIFTFNEGVASAFDPNKVLTSGSDWAKKCNIKEVSAGNYALYLAVASKEASYYGIVPANYDGTGFKFKPNTKYEVSFKYKTTKFAEDSSIGIRLYRTNSSGICANGGKTALVTMTTVVEAAPEWTGFSYIYTTGNFTGDQDYFNFNFGINKGDVEAYFDDLCITEVSDTPIEYTFNNKGVTTKQTLKPGDVLPSIGHPAFLGWYDPSLTTLFQKAPASCKTLYAKYDEHYVPPTGRNITMDFENEFKWSVTAANTYTYNSGNNYVTRGEILEDGDNHFFRVSHFKNMNGYFYFVADDGKAPYEVSNAGIYTVDFDYRVEHSETETAIGILYTNPANGKKTLAKEFAAFVYRDDAEDEWTHISYTFMADINADRDQNKLAFYVYNETRCPEEFASKIDFDNISITAVSISGEEAVLAFDTIGAGNLPSKAVPADTAIGAGILPEDLTKYGYAFNGWKYDETIGEVTTTKTVNASTVFPAGLYRVYADWILDPDAVELTFRCNVADFDDNTLPIVALKGGKINDIPEVPAVEGQHFEGWYLDRAFTKPLDPNCAPDASSMVFAKWKSDGVICDYENYTLATGTYSGHASDRFNRIEEPGNITNHVLEYDLSKGGNQSASSAARAQFHTGKAYIDAIPGLNYAVKFKYNVVKFNSAGTISVMLTSRNNTWGIYKQQANAVTYSNKTDGWVEATIEFTAVAGDNAGPNDCTLCFAVSGDGVIYFDDVVVITPENEMNFYGTAIRLNTNGGEKMSTISGYIGEEIIIPTPKKPGYLFKGWFLDSAFEQPFTQKYYTDETYTLIAKWQLGKFNEGFEEFPQSVKSLGVAGAYTFYSKATAGFDASNVHGGGTSLFRNGKTAGNKAFTLERNSDLALTVGEEYTLDFYVKPVSVTDATATINLLGLGTFTGINSGVAKGVVANVADLKVGEWNHVTYTFKAANQYVGISTGAGNDMYFDDFSITLKGYNGASTGDTSVSPMIILMIVVLSAGALLITGKKVFAK